MSDSIQDNVIVAQTAARAFGGHPKVTRFWDDDKKSHVDILRCTNTPQPGTSSYSTIGLSDHPLFREGKEYGARLEIVGACGDTFSKFDNALATAAFCIINAHWFCFPGASFPDVLKTHNLSSTMSHFFFVPPFLREESLKTLDLRAKKVTWLLAVPISEAELKYAEQSSYQELEDLFVEKQIDIFDLQRTSVL